MINIREKKWFVVYLSFIFFILSMTVVSAQEKEKPLKFIFATPQPGVEHIQHLVSVRFIKQLDQLSGGRITVEYHPGGVLGDWVAILEQVMTGVIPMAITYHGAQFDPRFNIQYLAYIASDWKKAFEIYGLGGPMLEIMDKIFSDMNVKQYANIPQGFGSIAMRKGDNRVPTKFPADGKGIKMRVPPFPLIIKRFEAWGFSPIPLPFPEIYTGLQLGTIDARSFAPPVEAWQQRDVVSSYILTRDYFEIGAWVANNKWWSALSTKDRGIIQEAITDSANWSYKEAEKMDLEYINKLKDYGVKVVELTPEELANAKKLCYENEWVWAEQEITGKVLMNKLKAFRQK